MRHLGVVTLIITQSLFFAILSASVLAEPDDILLPPEVRESIGKALGIDPNSGELERLVHRPPVLPADVRANYEAAMKGNIPQLAPMKIVKHYQFPTGKKFVPPPPQNAASSSQARKVWTDPKETMEIQKELALKARDSMLNPKELPRCTVSKTVSRKYADPPSHEIKLDVLIIDRDPPLEYDEVFGKTTKIIKYTTRPGDGMSAAMAKAGVDCLPYRVRIVGNTRYTYRGEDALKNFDKNPTGSGILSPLIKNKVSEYR